jgi:hypothetical protein
MNIIPLIFDRLTYFPDKNFLLMLLTRRGVRSASAYTKGLIVDLFRYVNATTDEYDKQIVIDQVKKLAYQEEIPKIFRANEGEDFCLTVDLTPGRTFEGTNIVARHAKDKMLLSSPLIPGTDELKQSVIIYDLPLQQNHFYKVHVLLEHPNTEGFADGDASVLLTDAILLVGERIDLTEEYTGPIDLEPPLDAIEIPEVDFEVSLP